MKLPEKIRTQINSLAAWIKIPANRTGLLICTVLAVLLISAGIKLNTPSENDIATSYSRQVFEKAVVTAVLYDDAIADETRAEGRRAGTQELEVKILSGIHKDEVMTLTNYLGTIFNVDAKKGDRIIVRILTDENGQYYAALFNHNKGLIMGVLILAFFAALSVSGGKKGIGAVTGLLFTLLCIWFILIPCIIRGIPAITVTVAITTLTAAASLILLNGFSEKTLCAILGCVGGVVVAGILAWIVGEITPMNGFNMSEAENLLLYGAGKGLRISGLMVCGILISSLGAVMDVSVSISSAMWEIKQQNPGITAKDIYRSGVHIGRDAMGTMANTLILAFAGSSLNMLILIQTYEIPFLQLVNTDYMCLEIIQSICASMGILFAVYIVAYISSKVMTRKSA